MEDYLEQKEDCKRESENASEESREKAAKDKATAEDMRHKATESLSETKTRAGSDLPKKKRKHNGNNTLKHLRQASDRECELKKQELEFKMEQKKSAAAQQTLMLQQMKNQQEQFKTMLQSQALHELLKERNWCIVGLICLDFMGVVVLMVTFFGNAIPLSPYLMYDLYLLFNEKLKQNSTFDAVEFHIDTKITEV